MKAEIFNRRLLSVGVLAASLSVAGISFAQDETDEDAAEEEEVLETVIVTGTRLERSSFDTTQPSTSFDSDFILNNGFNNTAEAILALPQMALSGTSLADASGNASRNVGQTFANLYNLGSQRTLTLINGRRTVSGNAPTAFGATGGSQVDLNTIPTSLVERVEVVSIGGAPIYGSDAIAGVVNVQMKRDFEGFEVDIGSGAAADGGDAWEHRIGVTAGFNFGDAAAIWLSGMSTTRLIQWFTTTGSTRGTTITISTIRTTTLMTPRREPQSIMHRADLFPSSPGRVFLAQAPALCCLRLGSAI